MYTVQEEIYILIYLILFGIYIFSSIDLIDLISQKIKNKVLRITLNILFTLIQIYITFTFSYNLMDGYVPIYFFIFIYIGFVIYIKLFKKYFITIITNIYNVLIFIIKRIIKLIKPFIYSKTIMKFIKREIKIIKNKKIN